MADEPLNSPGHFSHRNYSRNCVPVLYAAVSRAIGMEQSFRCKLAKPHTLFSANVLIVKANQENMPNMFLTGSDFLYDVYVTYLLK